MEVSFFLREERETLGRAGAGSYVVCCMPCMARRFLKVRVLLVAEGHGLALGVVIANRRAM
jgi:hypothetical protein